MSDNVKLGARARQKLARRAAILAAAERALGADDDVAVEGIAIAAGLAKGTVYNYFPDKAALVEAVMQTVERRLLASVAAALPPPAPPGRLALVLCGLLDGAANDAGAAAIACKRMDDPTTHGGAIGRAIAAELQIGGCASAGEEQDAAMLVLLGAIRAGMRDVTTPRPRRRARNAAIAAFCLRAVGVDPDAAETAVEAAMDALLSARRATQADGPRMSHAY